MLHTREVAQNVPANRLLFYSQKIHDNDEWSNALFKKKLQFDGGLGERMSVAFQAALKENDKVVIIGSDCIQINEDIIESAFQKLDESDIVTGPTFDGGYYLLGMKTLYPQLFQNIQWSSSTVFAETIKIVNGLGLKYDQLPKLSDIDYYQDWVKYGTD